MATPEEKRNKNLKEANELLSESIDLAGTLSDQMSFAYKKSQEKYFQDKQSVDLTKKLVDFTKNLSSQYTSIKDIEKDIAKNKKIQNEIARQQISFTFKGISGYLTVLYIKVGVCAPTSAGFNLVFMYLLDIIL